MRRLLGAGGPTRARRLRRDRVDGDQLLPGPGRVARRPGGRHGRGAGPAHRPAPGPTRDGGARRVAVRLLHAGLRVQHGRGVLPRGPGRHQRVRPAEPRRLPRRQRLRPACAERQPVPVHRLPADPRRRLCPRLPRRRRPPRLTSYDARAGGAAHPALRRRGGVRAADRSRRRPWRCWPRTRDAMVVAGSTDWGVDVNLKGKRATAVIAVDRLPELRGWTVEPTERSGSARRSR